MRSQIDQSNTTWRRQINTANTANENRANQTNAAIMLGLTQQAQNQLWQKYRDEAHQLYTSLENETQRNHQIVLSAMENQFNTDMFNRTVEFKKQVQAGAASQRLLEDAISFGKQFLTTEVKVGGKTTSLLGASAGALLGAIGLGGSDSNVDVDPGSAQEGFDFLSGIGTIDDESFDETEDVFDTTFKFENNSVEDDDVFII